jgi:hypothetical protein
MPGSELPGDRSANAASPRVTLLVPVGAGEPDELSELNLSAVEFRMEVR